MIASACCSVFTTSMGTDHARDVRIIIDCVRFLADNPRQIAHDFKHHVLLKHWMRVNTRGGMGKLWPTLTHFIHHCVAHPMLPLADVLDNTRFHAFSDFAFKLHDLTTVDDNDPPERYG